jgi:hypothetical protein
MFDSYHDHRTAYELAVNPAGVKRDELNGSSSWDAVWNARTAIDGGGWTAELRIPFSQLRFSAAELQTWGIQFSRRIVAKEEVTVFSFTPSSERGGVQRYGHLLGLRGLGEGRRLELLPYTVSRAEYLDVDPDDPYRDGADYFSGTGLDLKYRLNSTLTLDATVNPDFGQVEVDPAVVNLTAFETSFDEKRPFFLEGADIFRFDTRLFYSRRIGRSPQGSMPDDVAFADRPDASTILGAAKLTGRTANGWSIGLLDAVTAEERAPYRTVSGIDGNAIIEPRTNHIVARAEKFTVDGRTTAGAILTAVHRDLADDPLRLRLRSSAYTGGVDFAHDFADRAWTVNGFLAFSHIAGSPEALVRTQRSSARYYQRPDAGYLAVDSSLTKMSGYAARLEVRKVAGLHWRGEANVSMMSPGFEINDIGFQSSVDRVGTDIEVAYVENLPGSVFRSYRIEGRASRDWNYGRDTQGGGATLSFDAQLLGYWAGHLDLTRSFRSYDDRLTRGGPMAIDLPDNRIDMQIRSDDRKPITGRINGSVGWGESGGWQRNVSLGLGVRPAGNWSIDAGPSLRRNRAAAQYLDRVDDAGTSATYGNRYVFAPLDQTTLSMETRINVNFTPEISLDVFAQPFISTGDFGTPVQLRAARTFEFDPFDGEVENGDFTTRSLRGNAVLRWEWKAGSTLFFVWQQRRSGSLDCDDAARCERGELDLGRDVRALLDTGPENVFMVKMNYWLNL